MKTILILTAAALTGLTATASIAQTSVTVSYADLNLATTEGQATMAHRVNHAATVVCGTAASEADLLVRGEIAKCRVKVIADAKKALDAKNAPQFASR